MSLILMCVRFRNAESKKDQQRAAEKNSCTSQNMNYVNSHRTRDYTKPASGWYLIQFINTPLMCSSSYRATVIGSLFSQCWNSFFSLLCDKNLFFKAAFVASENRMSCSHKTLTWGWRKRLWEGHMLPLFGLQ